MKRNIAIIILATLFVSAFTWATISVTTNRLNAKHNEELAAIKTTYENRIVDIQSAYGTRIGSLKLAVRNYVLGDGFDLLFDKVGSLKDAVQIRLNRIAFEDEFKNIINNY